MNGAKSGSGQKFNGEITVRNGVHRIRGGAVEPKKLGCHVAVGRK